MSYFSTRVGSIIGAGRLSFRVRDGSGRFPAAVAAVTLFSFQPLSTHLVVCVFLVVGCGLLDRWFVVARRCGVTRESRLLGCFSLSIGGVCKFSAG